MDKGNKLLQLIYNKKIYLIIWLMQIFSFLLANLFVIIIFDYFMIFPHDLDFPYLYKIKVYLIGIILTVIIVKVDWVLKVIDKISKDNISTFHATIKRSSEDSLSDTVSSRDDYESSTSSISIRKIIKLFIIIVPRWFFFNVLKDGFFITIVWVVYIYVITWFDIINFPLDSKFSSLVGSISLIGIISGFFQLYINTYQNNLLSKVQNNISKYVKSKCGNITPREFYDFWSTYKRSSLLKNKYKNFIEIRYNTADDSTLEHISHLRNPISIHFHNTVLPSKIDIFTTLSNFEWLVQTDSKTRDESNIKELFEIYENYFKHKLNEFKKEFNVTDFNSDIQIQLLSIICFYGDLLIDIIEFDTYYAKNPKSFSDYYMNYINDCIMYAINTLTEKGI